MEPPQAYEVMPMDPDTTNQNERGIDLLLEFVNHTSWRCAYYNECHCGLDDATDRLGIPRIPYLQQ